MRKRKKGMGNEIIIPKQMSCPTVQPCHTTLSKGARAASVKLKQETSRQSLRPRDVVRVQGYNLSCLSHRSSFFGVVSSTMSSFDSPSLETAGASSSSAVSTLEECELLLSVRVEPLVALPSRGGLRLADMWSLYRSPSYVVDVA